MNAPLDPQARLDAPTTGIALLVNNDEQGFFAPALPQLETPNSVDVIRDCLEGVVDGYADAGVDLTSWCLWSWFKCTGSSSVVERRLGKPHWNCWEPLFEAGLDPVTIVQQRCRERNILFIAGMRMNDRHAESLGCAKGAFIMNHPEYQLEGMEEWSGLGVDYRHDAVREKVLDYIEDMLERYDVDGIEFDWMRWCHMFKPGTARQYAPLLTDFTRKARALLDAAAEKRGRSRLLLGARVANTLEESHGLGYEVEAWVKGGLVDYLCPTCFFAGDPNLAVEEFVQATQGMSCRVYPSVQFNAGVSLRSWFGRNLQGWASMEDRERVYMTTERYRAIFRSFINAGAQGTQTYNIFTFDFDESTSTNGSLNDYSEACRTFREPQTREYAFCPGFFHITPKYTGTPHVRHLEFPMPEGLDTSSFPFVLGEALGAPDRNVHVTFRVVVPEEDFSVTPCVNGEPIPEAFVSFTNETHLDLTYRQYQVAVDAQQVAPLFREGENNFSLRVDTASLSPEQKVLAGDLFIRVEEN